MHENNAGIGLKTAARLRNSQGDKSTASPYPPLLNSMTDLVENMRMLTSMAVAYGTKDRFYQAHIGNMQEVALDGAVYTPCVRPLHENTLYDLASLTKVFTMISVMQLVHAGQIALHDDIGHIDSRFSHLSRVRIQQVLSYEATLQTPRRIDEQKEYHAALQQVFSMAVSPTESLRPYSDMNALVLKYVVEKASGMRFFEYVKRNILSPAGMAETFVQVPAERLPDCACYNYEHRITGGQHSVRTDVPLGVPHDAKASILCNGGLELCGHAGLFSTLADMVRLCQALLSGKLLPMEVLLKLSTSRMGKANPDGSFRQYLGYLCFVKGPQQRFSEVPLWMSDRAFAQSGFTGNHIAIDPELGVFDLFLGNRCHNRVSVIQPPEGAGIEQYGLTPEGAGLVQWPDGRKVQSSYLYIHQKDEKLHKPIWQHMKALGWL